jgi:hypothetical protein
MSYFLFDQQIFQRLQKCSGRIRIRHWIRPESVILASRIRNSGLRIHGSGSEKNIYGSTTLLETEQILVANAPFHIESSAKISVSF